MSLQLSRLDANTDPLKEFADWILKVDDGKIEMSNDGFDKIEISQDLLIQDLDDRNQLC